MNATETKTCHWSGSTIAYDIDGKHRYAIRLERHRDGYRLFVPADMPKDRPTSLLSFVSGTGQCNPYYYSWIEREMLAAGFNCKCGIHGATESVKHTGYPISVPSGEFTPSESELQYGFEHETLQKWN